MPISLSSILCFCNASPSRNVWLVCFVRRSAERKRRRALTWDILLNLENFFQLNLDVLLFNYKQKCITDLLRKLFAKSRFEFSQHLSLFISIANLIITYYSERFPMRAFVKLFPFTLHFSFFQLVKSQRILHLCIK